MANSIPRPVYDLDSEVARLKRKFPEFELRLPGVQYSDQERAQHREDHDNGALPEDAATHERELPKYRLEPVTIKVPSLAFMSDEVAALSNTNPPAALRQHIGDEAYQSFVDRGGNAGVLVAIMQQDQAAHQGE